MVVWSSVVQLSVVQVGILQGENVRKEVVQQCMDKNGSDLKKEQPKKP